MLALLIHIMREKDYVRRNQSISGDATYIKDKSFKF